jgi:hypothetical protein
MWLFLLRILSGTCTTPAIATDKLSFGINANRDDTLDIAAMPSLASHPGSITLSSDFSNFSAQLFQRQ